MVIISNIAESNRRIEAMKFALTFRYDCKGHFVRGRISIIRFGGQEFLWEKWAQKLEEKGSAQVRIDSKKTQKTTQISKNIFCSCQKKDFELSS